MQLSLVMTVIGQDRPGLVDSVATRVAENGGNWLESRMSRLGGHFAGILRVEIPSEKEQPLVRSLKSLESEGLTVVVHSEKEKAALPEREVSLLEIVGQDRRGIVRQIFRVLASHGVNVEELETERSSAAMSGEMLFKASAKLHVPAACDRRELRRQLEKIAQDLIVDVSFQEPPSK